jgi:ribosome-binding protein aMBF1 (putative translation factor)
MIMYVPITQAWATVHQSATAPDGRDDHGGRARTTSPTSAPATRSSAPPEGDDKAVGERLQHERIRLRWSLDMLAERTQLSPALLASIERGEERPPPNVVQRIFHVIETYHNK